MKNNINQLPYSEVCKEKLHKFVDILINKIDDVVLIVLFGSYARMEQTATSDLDILALTETEVDRSLRGELCSIFDEYCSDLVFYTVDSFERSDCLLVKQIREDGILLWKK